MRDAQSFAKSWLAKAQRENEYAKPDHFDRFVYLWFAFNALYTQFYNDDERYAIRAWVDDSLSRGSLTNDDIVRLLQAPYAAFFRERIVRDVRRTRARAYGPLDTSENAITLTMAVLAPIKQLKALLMILYTVRCNLFHGEKAYIDSSDQSVIKHAADALEAILSA